jgi:hypothetical protein
MLLMLLFLLLRLPSWHVDISLPVPFVAVDDWELFATIMTAAKSQTSCVVTILVEYIFGTVNNTLGYLNPAGNLKEPNTIKLSNTISEWKEEN